MILGSGTNVSERPARLGSRMQHKLFPPRGSAVSKHQHEKLVLDLVGTLIGIGARNWRGLNEVNELPFIPHDTDTFDHVSLVS